MAKEYLANVEGTILFAAFTLFGESQGHIVPTRWCIILVRSTSTS